MVADESTFLILAMDAHGGHVVAILDIPWTFLHVPAGNEMHVLMQGILVEMIVKFAPNFCQKHVWCSSNSTPMLHAKMNKVMHGLLCSALEFCLKLINDLTACGFKMNPHDPCMPNATKKGKQPTTCWHTDNLKVPHVDPSAIDDFGACLCGIFGKKLTLKHGKMHNSLGTDMDFPTNKRHISP